jgi:hypothetical protein
MDMKKAKQKYSCQKSGCKREGIVFNLSFEEWCAFWKEKFEKRGIREGQFVMRRKGDIGAYELGNVYIGHPGRMA